MLCSHVDRAAIRLTRYTMGYDIRDRNFLTLLDFSPRDIRFLLDLARDLKRAKYGGYEQQRMRGKNIAVIFEKTSTRTRVAFEVAAYDQGAHVTYLGPSGTQIGEKESMKDTARVLGRIYDGIEYRGFGQEIVDELADNAGVPVWNGLTDEFHPTQILADFLTMRSSATSRSTTSRTASWATAASTWATRCSSAARRWAWTCASAPRRTSGRRRTCSSSARRSPRRPAPRSPSPTTPPWASRARTTCTPTSGSPWARTSRSGATASSCSSRTRSTATWSRRPATRT